MKPFSLVVPHNLADAAEAAQKPTAVLKAAGIDLLDRLKERIEAPTEVVSLLPLKDELAGIAEANGELRIGALVTLAQIADAAALAGPAFAVIREAAGTAATPQVRNRATVAGNLVQKARCWYLRSAAFGCLHGRKGPACLAMTGENRYHSILGWHDCVRVHPSSLAPALLAMDAEYTTFAGGKTQRRKLGELYPKEAKALVDEHTLAQGEIITALHVPPQPADARSCYRESREKLSFDWATTAAAVRLQLAGGKITAATIVLGAVAPVPLPRPEAAKLLVGKAPSDELFKQVAEAAFTGAMPLAQNAYKVPVGMAVLREALHECAR
ncbi:MAG TPA: FAD binding domain-containing protein [Planctomycetota bacterium]|nr:FAD binding domain-containing protein [Planctomycetota bacterium]